MMKVRIVQVSLIFIALLPQLVFADVKPNTITLTLGGGYIFFAPKRDLQNNNVISMALAYNFTEKWGIEGAANLINAHSNNPTKQHEHGFLYILDGMYRLSSYRFIDPYLLAGFNIMNLKPGGNESIDQGGMNAGVGAQFFTSKFVGISAEARDVYTFVGGKNDVLLNLGINFLWE